MKEVFVYLIFLHSRVGSLPISRPTILFSLIRLENAFLNLIMSLNLRIITRQRPFKWPKVVIYISFDSFNAHLHLIASLDKNNWDCLRASSQLERNIM